MSVNKGNTASDYLAAYERLGSYRAVAREFGVHEKTVRESINRAREKDPALQSAMNAIGTGMTPSIAWVKTKPKDGEPGYSVMLRPSLWLLALIAMRAGVFDPREKFTQGDHAVSSASDNSWATAQRRSHGMVCPSVSLTPSSASRPCPLIG